MPTDRHRFALVPAFSTLGCPDLTLEEAAALAKAHDIAHVELRALAGTVALPDHLAARYGTPERLAAAFHQLGIAVPVVGTSLRLIGSTAERRDAFLRCAPWAVALGTPHLRVFDGGTAADDAELADAADTLHWWDTTRQQHGWPLNILVETHDALVHPENLQRFLDRHPTRKLVWDTHHTWRMGGESPSRTWQRVRHAALHIHVKDSAPRADAPGYAYVGLGEGGFPMTELLSVLQQDRFPGCVSLEWERLWHPGLAPLGDVLPGFAALFS